MLHKDPRPFPIDELAAAATGPTLPRAPSALPETLDETSLAEALSRRRWIGVGALVVLSLLALASLWRFTPLREWADLERLQSLAEALRGNPAAPLIVIGVFVAAAFVLFPHPLLMIATVVVFGGLRGAIYAWLGSMAATIVTYGVGRLLERRELFDLSETRWEHLRAILAERALIVVILLRMLPIAPMIVVNLACGAVGISFRTYVLGTAIGMLPSMVYYGLFASEMANLTRHPSLSSLPLLVLVILAVVLLARWARRAAVARGWQASSDERA